MLLALFCGFFVNLIKKSLTTRFGICHFISLFRVFLDGDACAVQPSPAAKASSLRRKGTAYPFCGVDALSLCAGADLLKRRSCCFGERKYFSSALFIKISDKVHPLAGLRDAEIFAVKHLPFHTISHQKRGWQHDEDNQENNPQDFQAQQLWQV